MRIELAIFCVLGVAIGATASSAIAQTPGHGVTGQALLLVHYMPWFTSKPVSGSWGRHWAMGSFNPDKFLPDGRREIAAHEYPLIGPYDSADPNLVEFHVLLMKLAGIDGVIADWYGNEDREEFQHVNRATIALLREIERRGMKFAITFEDRIYVNVDRERAINLAADALGYATRTFFPSPAYLRVNGRPLVLLFGPVFFDTAEQWNRVLAGAGEPRPKTYVLHDGGPADAGHFAWPPMQLCNAGTLTPEQLRSDFSRFYTGDSLPAALTEFHDIYHEAGVRRSYGYLDARDGATFRETLDAALRSKQPIVQLITWNDFGEGTAIEPTREFGTRFLDEIHRARTGKPLERLAVATAQHIYELRESPQGVEHGATLERAVDLLYRGDTVAAISAIDAITGVAK